MAKSRKLEELLASVDQLRDNPTSETAIAQLRQIIGSPYGVAVAQAAKIVGKAEITELTPEIVQAFDRFLVNPGQTDPNCLAKDSLAEALYRMGRCEEIVFLKGIRHVQMEPVFGGRVDTAPKLRGTCALGLVRMSYPEIFLELADLLADPEPQARIGAARGLAYTSNPNQAIPLLRLRARLEDRADVLAEYCVALLNLSSSTIDFVTQFLYVPQAEMQEMTALVLGESRLPEAFDVLRIWWKKTVQRDLRRTALLSIAMLRSDEAIDFLLSLLAEAAQADVKDTLAALAPYQQDTGLWQRIADVLEQRQMVDLL